MPGPDVSIAVGIHPTGLWLTVPLTVDGHITLLMVFDPGSPTSAISPSAERILHDEGMLSEPPGSPSYMLTSLTSQDQPLPDLRVRVLARLGRLARWRVRSVPLE